jgi:hypothetical protein
MSEQIALTTVKNPEDNTGLTQDWHRILWPPREGRVPAEGPLQFGASEQRTRGLHRCGSALKMVPLS